MMDKEYKPYFNASLMISPYQESIRVVDDNETQKKLEAYGWIWSRLLQINAPMWNKPKHGEFYDVSIKILKRLISKEHYHYLKLHIRRMKYQQKKKVI